MRTRHPSNSRSIRARHHAATKATGQTPRCSSGDTLAPSPAGHRQNRAHGAWQVLASLELVPRLRSGGTGGVGKPAPPAIIPCRPGPAAVAWPRPPPAPSASGRGAGHSPMAGTGSSCTPRNRPNCTKVPLAPDRSFDNTAQVTDALRVARTAFQQCRSVTMRAMMPMHRRGNTLQDGGCAGGCCVSGDAGTVPCCATGAFPGDGPILHDWPFGARR